MDKSIDKKRSFGAVSKELTLETHVIRFWESKFPQIKPKIGKGKRRYYFDKEIAVLSKIKSLLYDEGYSISGLQKLLKKRKKSNLKEQNIEFLLTKELEEHHKSDSSKDDQDRASGDANKKIEIDDFISSNVILSNFTANLKGDEKSALGQIVNRIEANLNKLENL
jgi:DNA-binding transcriptional MerR regulator